MELNDKQCPYCDHDRLIYTSANWVICEHCDKRWEVGRKVEGEYNWFAERFDPTID